jgi:hypothetical protein
MSKRLRVLGVAGLLSWSACTCGTRGLSSQAGELAFVSTEASGEQLAANGLVTVPPVAMGDVGLGEVRVRNVGSGPLTITTATPAQDALIFSLPELEGLRLEAGAEASSAVRFAPPQDADPTLPTVEHRSRFTLALSGTRPERAQATLDLVGQALARDCFVPAEVDFGDVAVGLRVSVPFVLENGSSAPTTVTFGQVGGANPALFELGAVPQTLESGARVEVPLWFGPLAEVSSSATLLVQRSGCAPVTVRLLGRGVATSLAWAPLALDFGKVPLGSTSPTQVVQVTNQSNATLRLADALASSDYVVTAPAVVPARGVAKVQVACRPGTLGRLPATLSFSVETSPATSVRVPLTCQGGGPRVRLLPAPLLMGATPSLGNGALAASRRLTVQNVGTPPNAPLDASNNLLLGVGGRPPVVSIVPITTNVAPGEFEVVVPSNYPALGLPALAGSNGVDLQVLLRPRSKGLKQVEVQVYTNDALTPVARVVVSADVIDQTPCSGLKVTPALAFGDTPPGVSTERTLVLENAGQKPCQVSGLDLTPGSSRVFSLADVGQVLVVPAQSTVQTRVRATLPADAPVGQVERGWVQLFTSDATQPVLRVPLDIRVAACLLFSPSALDLGQTAVTCRSAERGVALYDTCGVPVTVAALAIKPAGSPFTLTSGPLVDGADGGLELTSGTALGWGVTFTPGDAGVGFAQAVLEATTRLQGVTHVLQVPLQGQATATSEVVEDWTQGQGDLDILFVVDNSCSMADEQQALAANFSSFSAHLLLTRADFHLGVTTTDVFVDSGAMRGQPAFLTPQTPQLSQAFGARALAGVMGSGFEQPFEGLLRAVTSPMAQGTNAGFLRPGAPLAAIIVTDAVEQSPQLVDAYLAGLRAVKANRADLVSISVVGPFTPASATCQLDTVPDQGRYQQAITATGGVKADICTTNWARDLDVIGNSLAGLTARFPLKSTPDLARPFTVTVDGVATTGWSYDARSRALVFTTPPPAGAHIIATYRTVCL